MSKYGVNELRKMFLDFFESKGHLIMDSFSLIPKNDKSLLLINSGMAPLKPYFTGQEIPPRNRVATCQKCIRTGDIENIGKTARHGTFFEMLGNFSFGDYFKREAIKWSWEFLTEVVGLDPNRLYPSVYLEDDEAFEIWNKEMGIPAERIYKFGKEDNFWEHGAGPCGPCSEIYYDRGEKYGCESENCEVGCDCDRYIEVWNNVFTQFENDGEGNYTRLKKTNIDTGMGLERLAVVVQDVDSIFDVDTLQSIIKRICELSGKEYHKNEKDDMSIRLIADHLRSATFMISDGILPSNEGRGYVLRRLLRRAARHGGILGIKGSFLSKISEAVIDCSKSGYPELDERREAIFSTIDLEESQFAKTLNQGIEMLKELVDRYKSENNSTVSGKDVFKLYDTYGFPLDIAKDYLEESGMTVDEGGFNAAMKEQKDKARSARAVSNYMGAEATVYDEIDPSLTSEFVGYENHEFESKIIELTTRTQIVDVLKEGDEGTIFVEQTPFYATSGGQSADKGIITLEDAEFEVFDVQKLRGGKIAHIGRCVKGEIKKGKIAHLSIDVENRVSTEANHSATHLLHKALRTILGKHVTQAGSLVEHDKLRFDFTHPEALTSEQIRQIEDMVNYDIRHLDATEEKTMSIEEAKKLGAMALFGEKYGDVVRVIKMGDSIELCGGTHVMNTGAIQGFKVISESGVAAGVRRIEAVTGKGMFDYINKRLDSINDIAKALKTSPSNLEAKINQLLDELKQEKREIDILKSKLAKDSIGEIKVETINGKNYICKQLSDIDVNELRKIGDDIKSKNSSSIILLSAVNEGRVVLLSMVTDDYVACGIKAGDIIKEISPLVGGKGGGRPNMAQGGGTDPSKIDLAFDRAREIISNK